MTGDSPTAAGGDAAPSIVPLLWEQMDIYDATKNFTSNYLFLYGKIHECFVLMLEK